MIHISGLYQRLGQGKEVKLLKERLRQSKNTGNAVQNAQPGSQRRVQTGRFYCGPKKIELLKHHHALTDSELRVILSEGVRELPTPQKIAHWRAIITIGSGGDIASQAHW